MNDVSSFFAPTRARAEAPAPQAAPERRMPDAGTADFARSLANVRGMERSALRADRAADMRAAVRTNDRTDDRTDVRTDDPSCAVRTRAQVQALMLSGAMKFAAARVTDATVTPNTPMTPADLQAAMVVANPIAEVVLADSAVIDTETVMADVNVATVPDEPAAADVPALMAPVDMGSAASLPDVAITTPVADDAAAVLAPQDDTLATLAAPVATDDASVDVTPSAEATAAALQLVAQLPLAAPTVTNDVPEYTPTPSTAENNDDAARAAWERRMAALAQTEASALVEDHFDAPASAGAIDISGLSTSADALQAVLPETVTMTFADTMAAATETVAPETTATASSTEVAPTVTVKRTIATGIERDIAPLAPEFRERLQRVMDRMKQEFGHDVTVVETVRSQARQAALYAQGRSTPGPVVTWTRNSKHSKGLAADLMVDGQWDNPAGYAHLAQIAKEEGLRTLGARDPGHVELPSDANVSAETLGSLLSDLGGDAGDGARKMRAELELHDTASAASGVARVADVAQVARVSQVAQVARVATVARPGAGGGHSESRGNDNISPLAMTSPMPQFVTDATVAARAASTVSPVNMADRISQLMDIQASQSAKPLNSVLLRMDNANGIEDQIRIDTRGTSVDAQLGLGNAQQAAELSARVSELREALERRGLTADGVRVQASPRATDSVHFTRMPAQTIDVAALRAASDAQAQSDTRDQASRDQQHREAMARQQDRPTPRSSSDESRHRSRREQPETRQ